MSTPAPSNVGGRVLRAGRWLLNPLARTDNPNARRAHLLAWMLVTLLVITLGIVLLVLVVDPVGSPRRTAYIGLILGLDGLLLAGYLLNCAGKYALGAGMLLLCAVLGPWASMALDPNVLRGDFVPLAYVAVSILLASILLSPLVTSVLALAEFVGLALIPAFNPATRLINWPSLLAFVFMVSTLSILSSVVTRSDMADINRQAHALANSEARLRELSVRDPLTGLFNRRYLEETLEREIQRALRSGAPIGVIMIDVDHFKHINDRRGHAAGDEVLQQIAALVAGNVRACDIACRYGGDEFLLVLPDAGPEVTRERAELLRQSVRGLQACAGGQPVGTVTISAGVAAFCAEGASAEAVLRAADLALYRAKAEGRDRVTVA